MDMLLFNITAICGLTSVSGRFFVTLRDGSRINTVEYGINGGDRVMLILAVIGGIIGIVIGIFAVIIGAVSMTAGASSYLIFGGAMEILFGIVGIVGGVLSKSKLKLASVLLIVAGVVGSILVTVYIVPGILLVIAGVMGLSRLKMNRTPSA